MSALKKEILDCPVCSCPYPSDELPLHVEQHFDSESAEVARRVCEVPGCSASLLENEYEDHMLAHTFETSTGNSSNNQLNDSMLARIIQEENAVAGPSTQTLDDEAIAMQIHKEDNRKIEEENFRSLQETYGMDNKKGGYVKQFEQTMDRHVGSGGVSVGDYYSRKADLHSAMMSGHDSCNTRTPGVVPILKSVCVANNPPQERYYAVDATDHFAGDVGDKGWGCGYRNIQMMMSALLADPTYSNQFRQLNFKVPSIPKIQQLIECAWADGYDRAGCEQLNGKLSGTKKWVGTTEAVALLAWLRIRARVVDFHRPTGEDKQHPEMFNWIFEYFKARNTVGCAQPAFPLYIQHQGHSRTCVGCEKNSKWESPLKVVIFDPGCAHHKMVKLTNAPAGNVRQQCQGLKKSLKQMRQSQFQLVYVDGVYETPTEIELSKFISSQRIPP